MHLIPLIEEGPGADLSPGFIPHLAQPGLERAPSGLSVHRLPDDGFADLKALAGGGGREGRPLRAKPPRALYLYFIPGCFMPMLPVHGRLCTDSCPRLRATMATAWERPRVPGLGLLATGRPNRSSGLWPLRLCSEHTKDTCMPRPGAQLPAVSALLPGSEVICPQNPFSAGLGQDFIPEGSEAAGCSFGTEDLRRRRWKKPVWSWRVQNRARNDLVRAQKWGKGAPLPLLPTALAPAA